MFLVLDKHLQDIPWESFNSLRRKSITRVASLEYLSYLLDKFGAKELEIDASKAFYVLNPSGDLVHTQGTFQSILKEKKLEGVSGTTPSPGYIENCLEKYDLFLYFGHGGAEQFVKRNKIKKLSRCSSTLLLGCSSGRLFSEGEFDLEGTAMDYAVAEW
jgi:separase